MMRGFPIFLAGVLVFWGLYLAPFEIARVVALSLLVLVVLTPAVGRR